MKCSNLKKHKLWYDGDISVSPEDVASFLLSNNVEKIYVDRTNDEIIRHNKLATVKERIEVKTECKPLDFTWNIPEEYKQLNIRNVITDLLAKELDANAFTDRESELRLKRVLLELKLYEKNNLFDVLRTILFIINTFTEHNIVWGVGRGSSVSSYVLYLLGVHDVDSVKYDLHITDFIS